MGRFLLDIKIGRGCIYLRAFLNISVRNVEYAFAFCHLSLGCFIFPQISPSLALGHFILGNVFGAQVS